MNGRTIRVTLMGGEGARAHQAHKIHVTEQGVLVLMDRSDHVLVTYAPGTWLSAVEEN